MTYEKWMNIPITFLPVLARDLSEEDLVVEGEIEGHLPRITSFGDARLKAAQSHSIYHPWNDEVPNSIGNFGSDRKGSLIEGLYATQKPAEKEQRHFRVGTCRVITKEVAEWLKAGIVRPVKYPTWISKPVLVKKVDGSWRMCIDFKNINAACPKDYYPLPEIDSKIESVMGFPLKCFLDAYKGYHQVEMKEEDEEKTAFYMDQAFQSQIGRNLEAYVDDMVVKSKFEREMLADIAETFDNLRRINMKLNLKRCSFRVEEGNFLGYMVTSEGIRANPAKTKDIAEMQSPRTWGEMQSLAGKLAALNHFLSRSAKKSLPFFKTLKDITKADKHDYRWIEKAKNAFQELKKMILDLPALTTLLLKETLFIYLAASKEAVSAVLLVVRKGKQYPIHYISKTLHDAEQNYALLEKMALALRYVSRRLRRYFEAHPITVITDQPIKQILSEADTSGKLAQYSVELGAYNITYEPRSAIKGQILADFINEVSVGSETMVPRQTQYTIDCQKDCKEERILYTDGASSVKGSGAGLVLISPTKTEYTYALRLNFESTNIQAEYKALLAGLRIAKKMGVQSISVNVDSKLVASQLNGNYEACKENMIRYLSKAKEYISCFKKLKIQNIPRNKKPKGRRIEKIGLGSIQSPH
ncbi:reverse transcriptase domain-containing protein [Tanacetum coccineum]